MKRRARHVSRGTFCILLIISCWNWRFPANKMMSLQSDNRRCILHARSRPAGKSTIAFCCWNGIYAKQQLTFTSKTGAKIHRGGAAVHVHVCAGVNACLQDVTAGNSLAIIIPMNCCPTEMVVFETWEWSPKWWVSIEEGWVVFFNQAHHFWMGLLHGGHRALERSSTVRGAWRGSCSRTRTLQWATTERSDRAEALL